MQRLHSDDLAQRIIDDGAAVLQIPMEYDPATVIPWPLDGKAMTMTTQTAIVHLPSKIDGNVSLCGKPDVKMWRKDMKTVPG